MRRSLAILPAAGAVAAVLLSASPVNSAQSCFGAATTGGWDPVHSTAERRWFISGNGRSNVGVFNKVDRIWVTGAGGDDRICTGATSDELLGDNGIDAPAGNDMLNGGGGRDILLGYAGRDILRGGPGADSLVSCEVVR